MANEILDPDLADYRQSLSELVVNSKPHILMLTMLAEDCKDTKAREIVAIIEQRILQGPIQHKMPALYLIDSICKNMVNSSYVRLFEKSIVKMFTVAFVKADEKTKILMYKLRQTWSELFSNESMHALDNSIRKIDPNWPIVPLKVKDNQQQQQQQQQSSENGKEKKTNPPPLVPSAQQSRQQQQQPQGGQFHRVVLPPGTSVESNEVVIVKKNSINNTIPISRKNSDPRRERVKLEDEQEEFSRKITDVVVEPRRNIASMREHALARATQLAQSSKSNNNCSSQPDTTTPQSPRKQPASVVVGANANASQNKKHSLTSIDLFSTTNHSGSSSSALNNLGKIKKKNKNKGDFPEAVAAGGAIESQRPKQFDNKPEALKKNTKAAVAAAMKRKHSASNAEPVHTKQPRKSSMHAEVTPLPVAPDDVIPLGKKLGNSGPNWKPPLRSQAAAAASSFKSSNAPRSSSPPTFNASRKRQPSSPSRKADLNKKIPVAKTNIPAPNIFAQPDAVFSYPTADRSTRTTSSAASGFGGQDVDYRIIPTTSNAAADIKPSISEEMLVIEGNRQLYEINKLGAPIIAPQVMPAGMPVAAPVPAMPPPPAPTGPLIEPDSMVLFINDKAHRLFYIDHVTAVVLRNVHPDRAFESLLDADPFQLDPRRVFFQGQPTTVFIDRGQPYEQTFRLDFNALQPFTFYLPGTHVSQTLMLGLPGRELVVNGRSYNIQFGNREALRIYFDHDNMFHTFQLSDSKPSLQFSDDVRPDLWFQLVKDARIKSGHIAPTPPANTGYNSFEQPVGQFPSQAPPAANYAPPQPAVTFSSYAPPVPAPMPSQTYEHPLATATAPTTTIASGLPDIKNLLSKLTQAGLISVTNAVTSSTTTTATNTSKADRPKNARQQKREEKKAKQIRPRQYLPLDMKKLQEPHDFAIEQLYTGSRCTNCSLRFNDDESLGNGKKTSYARHLDWHFRQNRRERGKPDGSASSSTPVSHRQSYYYSLDLWILFKEVNDNVEEEGEEEKTSNIAGNLLTSTVDNLDFAKYRENISDFDGFIDSINDNSAPPASGDDASAKKVCTVSAEADTKLNCCAVCNEKFEVKWEEDDEEWHCLNALRFQNLDEDLYTPVVSRIYHPLCLKDYLMQQEQNSTLQVSMDGMFIFDYL